MSWRKTLCVGIGLISAALYGEFAYAAGGPAFVLDGYGPGRFPRLRRGPISPAEQNSITQFSRSLSTLNLTLKTGHTSPL